MSRDYRIGLITGTILVGVALFWVATRPSMSPQPATMLSSPDAGPPFGANQPGPKEPAESETEGGSTRASIPQDSSWRRPEPPARDGKEPAQTTRVHLVRQGETLSSIAQQYYGTANDWRKILAANEKTLKDANKIAPGTKLVIPE